MNEKKEFLYHNNNCIEDDNNLNEDNLKMLEEGLGDLINEDLLYNEEEEKNDYEKRKEEVDSENILLSLNNQIETLKNLLNEKREEIDKINNEKNTLKLSLLQLQEEMFSKNQEYKLEIKQLEDKIKASNLEKEEYEKKNKELNIKIKELKDNLIYSEQLKTELSKLKNRFEETQLNSEKIINENNILKQEIEQKDNEINYMKKYYQREIENFNKEINNLKLNNNNKINDNLINKRIINNNNEKKIYNYEKTMSNYNIENINLKKLVQKFKEENEEKESIIEGKNKKIEKLKLEYEERINNLKIQLDNYEEENN